MATQDQTLEELKARIAELNLQLAQQQRQNDRFERVVESSPHGIIVANQAGRIVLVNQMAERLFGYSREDFLELSILDLVPERFRESHEQNRILFHSHPAMRQMGEGRDLHARRRDGSEFPVEIGLTPLPDPEGIHVLAVVIDITERKRTEDELHHFALELKRRNAELESFASVASHDLQEPLRKIRTMGERLGKLAEGELSEKGSDYLRRMIDASERMHQLIRDLLAFSRISTRTQPFEMVNLQEPIHEVLITLEIAIEESGGKVEIGDLPSAEVDRSQIRQVFQNLIGNALKFARPGVPPFVTIQGQRLDEDHCVITVRDNGIGFEQHYAERIFSIFQRLHGRDEYEGTGVGLAICQKIIDRHGGRIDALGEPGIGAEFRVILPRFQEKIV